MTGDREAHQICFDIVVANITAELEAFVNANPNDWEKLANGRYRPVAKA